MKKLAIALILLLPLYGCETIKSMAKTGGSAGVGALIGSLLGLPGTIVGAFFGGGFGGIWTQNDMLREQVTKAETERDKAIHDRDDLTIVTMDNKRRLDAMANNQQAPKADPNLPTLHYGPDPVPIDYKPWYRMTPWQWLKHKFQEGL